MTTFSTALSLGCAIMVGSGPGSRSAPNRSSTEQQPATYRTFDTRVLHVEYRGRDAIQLAPLTGHEHDTDQEMYATVVGSDLHDGTIDVDVAGDRRAGYSTAGDSTGFKGIIGISFRIRGDTAERFYIRPRNSRGASQLYRNRSTQYEASPGYPWNRLRQEHPGEYESYVDLEPGAWTHLRIVARGSSAELFVNGAAEPALVVNDLMYGDGHGAVALWSRISTDGYFANLRITPAPAPGSASSTRTITPDSWTATSRRTSTTKTSPPFRPPTAWSRQMCYPSWLIRGGIAASSRWVLAFFSTTPRKRGSGTASTGARITTRLRMSKRASARLWPLPTSTSGSTPRSPAGGPRPERRSICPTGTPRRCAACVTSYNAEVHTAFWADRG